MGTHRLAPGIVLGRYELLLPIAQGGMATVWAARQKGSRGFSKTVAVKTMLPNLSEDPTFEQMFLDEASIASRIHHPNVAEILDLGEQDEVLYLVMEWVDGESLSALSKQTKKTETEVPLRVALKIVGQACAGLHAAHELKDDNDASVELVHRDVSPQNILVASTGHVKLVDFGVAKALGKAGATSVGQLKGKVPYMSPEQTRGHDVDRRTDIFAMGSVVYRITTGFHPFIEENDIKTMRSIASRPPIRPRVKNPNLPIELEQVILKALEKNPEKRFQTAAELEAELDRVMASSGGPVSVDEIGAFVRTTLGERDQKRRAALRDAVNAADEQRRGGAPVSRASRNSDPTVSDLMLTQAATPPSFASGAVEAPDDDADHGPESEPKTTAQAPDDDDESTRLVSPPSESPRDAARPLTAEGAVAAAEAITRPSFAPPAVGPVGDPRLASSPTLAAVMDGTGRRAALKRRLGPLLAAAAVILLLAIVVPLILLRASHTKGESTPGSDAVGNDKSRGAMDDKSNGERPSKNASADGAENAKATPPPSASAMEDGSTFAIDELPDNTAGPHARFGQHAPLTGASGAPKGGAAPVASVAHGADTTPKPADTSKPAASPTAKPWVPAVQDPGF